MADIIEIKVTGMDKVLKGMERFPVQIAKNIGSAGKEASRDILDTQGLRKYPPPTAANQPPVPYYVRGRGMQTKRGNLGNSERYGTQFYTESRAFTTTIGNRASYAKYLGGDEQARAMERIGWKKLWDVASEKVGKIQRIYQAWIDKTIKDLGL